MLFEDYVPFAYGKTNAEIAAGSQLTDAILSGSDLNVPQADPIITDYLSWLYPSGFGPIVIGVKPPPGTTYGDGHPLAGKPRGYCGYPAESVSHAVEIIERAVAAGARSIWSSVHRGSAYSGKWEVGDTSRFQFLALDFDTALPIGIGHVCATDAEVAAVGNHVDAVMIDLADRGLPTPLHVHTGNGHLLLYPIDLWTVDDNGMGVSDRKGADNIALMQRLGDCLAVAYSKPGVCTLDTGVIADPSRILGVVGTVNHNKPEVPEQGRVARMRQVVGEYPDRTHMAEDEFVRWAEGYITEAEQLHADKLEGSRPAPSSASTPRAGATPAPRLDNTSPASPEQLKRAMAYIAAIPPAVEGNGGDRATFKAAGAIYHKFQLTEQQVFEAMQDWNARCTPPWDDDALRAKIRSATVNGRPPAPLPDRDRPRREETGKWFDDVEEGGERKPICELEDMDAVVARAIDWIWPGRIARGKLTLICGDPGKGKSNLSMDIAARLSSGTAFPDGHVANVGTTLIITDEDDSADTIKPRLMAMGADCTKIKRLKSVRHEGKQQAFSLKLVHYLADALKQCPDTSLIIIDPLMSYFAGVKSADPAEVNALLGMLNEFAGEHRIAVMALVHLNKDSKQSSALYRSMGSISVIGKARLAFLIASDKTDPSLIVMASTKANSSAPAPSLGYRLVSTTVTSGDQVIECPRVVWQAGTLNVAADDLLSPAAQRSGRENAEDFLREYLTEPRAALDVVAEGERRGFNKDMLWRAKKEMGIRAQKAKGSLTGGWLWLPLAAPTDTPAPRQIGQDGGDSCEDWTL